MQYKEQTINCPKCSKNIKIKMLEQIDESKFKDVISRKIFKFKCSYCKNEVIIDYPTTFIGENFEVCYKLTKKKGNKTYLRECYDFDDFKEKILIFSANLNDIAIEFIKDYLLNENWYTVNPVSNEQVYTEILIDVLDRYSKKYKKEKRGVLSERK